MAESYFQLSVGNAEPRRMYEGTEALALARGLSMKERETLSLLVNGMSNKEIGEIMAISEATVKAHVSSIFRKTGAVSRLKLISMITSLGGANNRNAR